MDRVSEGFPFYLINIVLVCWIDQAATSFLLSFYCRRVDHFRKNIYISFFFSQVHFSLSYRQSIIFLLYLFVIIIKHTRTNLTVSPDNDTFLHAWEDDDITTYLLLVAHVVTYSIERNMIVILVCISSGSNRTNLNESILLLLLLLRVLYVLKINTKHYRLRT